MGGNSRLSILLVVLVLVVATAGKIFNQPGESQLRRHDSTPTNSHRTPGRAVLPASPIPNLPDGMVGRRAHRAGVTGGTAFAIAPGGIWLTAKHVVDHCSRIAVLGKRPRRGDVSVVKNLSFHPNADVAVVTAVGARSSREPFKLASNAAGTREAFHVGYPQGKPSAVYSRYLGAKRVRHQGSSGGGEVVRVWAERRRFPNFSGSLGGMSGGPVFDNTGAVIGISIAENPRRGRILTSTPRTLLEATRLSGRNLPPAPSARRPINDLTPENFPKYSRKLLESTRVARVICQSKTG